MGTNYRILLGTLASLATSALLVWAIVADGFAAPNENGWVYNWQTLIAGFLALVGAGLVLVSARRQIENANRIADEQNRQRLYAARMSLTSQLEDMARQYDQTLLDIDNSYSSDGERGRRHTSLPTPPFTNDSTSLSALPASESEALTRLAKDVAGANDLAALANETEDEFAAADIVEAYAAEFALRAMEWNERFALAIGWKPMHFDPARRKQLQKMHDEELKRHERNLADNGEAESQDGDAPTDEQ